MRIALAQINSHLGAFAQNREKIVSFAGRARDKRCDLVVFPELALFGYLPGDLLERHSIVDAQLAEFRKLEKEIPAGIGVIVGLITETGKKIGKPYFNSAAFIQRGKKTRFFHKELLPTYDIFDEARHSDSGKITDNEFQFKGKRILLTICEDIWGWELHEHQSNYLENPLQQLKGEKFDLILNLSASPYTQEKSVDRLAVVQKTVKFLKAPMVYVNQVGAQDELIFDGGSLAVAANGKILARNIYFGEDLNVIDLESKIGGIRPEISDVNERTRQAIVLGIRDYVHKTGFRHVHLGLSGGIDSAVVACLAVDALGPKGVTCFTLPGPFNPEKSRTLARAQARVLGIKQIDVPISTTYEVVLETLHKAFGNFEFGTVNENLQSRIRGLFLMAFANKENSMLLSTGNKSEYATGYATLYGDMCGGLAPIADLVKEQVYAIAALYNKERELIPNEVLTRAPSAELRPNQKDQDSLPPYPELDNAVRRLVEKRKPAETPLEHWLLNAMVKNEFKRWQAPPILKISQHAFGRGRRMPIAHKALF